MSKLRFPLKASTSWLTALIFAFSLSGALASDSYLYESVEERMTLDEALVIAFENSFDIRLAQLRVEEAQLDLTQAEATNLIMPSPTNLIEARRKAEIAAQQLLLDEFNLKAQVEEDYYSVLRAWNLLKVAEEAFSLAQRQLDIAEQKLATGAETRADVLNASSSAAEAEANVAQARGGLDLTLLNFRRTLGVDYNRPIAPETAEFDALPYDVSLEDDIAFALKHRIEVLQLLTAVEATEKQIQLSDNDYTPEIALKAARLALEKIKIQRAQLETGIQLEVRQAYLGMEDQNRRLPVLKKRVEEAEENLRVATHLYDADMAPLLQVTAAQTALSQAKTDYIHAVFDYNIARSRYDRAVARPLRSDDTK